MTYVLSGLTLSAIAWLWHFWLAKDERVPRLPLGMIAAHVIASLVAFAGVFAAEGTFGVVVAASLATVTFLLGGGYVFLTVRAPLPDQKIRVAVGESLLPFVATRSNGQSFSSEDFSGRRILLKFFRGSW